MKRIGIYGGAFNSPTIGHKHVINYIHASGLVDEIWVIPSYIHFHGKYMAPYADRCMMCELMISTLDDSITVKELDKEIAEFNSDYNGSTIQFMEHLRNIIDKDELDFYIIIGQDNAESIETWNKGNELIEQEKFIVIPRASAVNGLHYMWYLNSPNYFMDRISLIDVSSTEARNECTRISEHGASDRLKYILGHDVFAYVQNKKFYME